MVKKEEIKKFAVIRTGGKQYKVSEGEILEVEKLGINDGESFNPETLLFVDGSKVEVGRPILDKVKVTARVISQEKADKIIVFKYKAKKNVRTKTGHRQKLTRIEIEKISA